VGAEPVLRFQRVGPTTRSLKGRSTESSPPAACGWVVPRVDDLKEAVLDS